MSRGIQFRHWAAKISRAPEVSLQEGTPMARLACLTTLTVLFVAAPEFGQAAPDAKAPSSDDYVLVDATNLRCGRQRRMCRTVRECNASG